MAPRTSGGPGPPLPPGTLPLQIQAMLAEIGSTLDGFSKYPPHTVQRLAELVLTPRRHYRTLPTYLHALDRVVHVTSGLDVYPLPPAVPDTASSSVLSNGISDVLSTSTSSSSAAAAPGSDEALGGALLTPIPWLQPNQQHTPSSSTSPQPQSQLGTLTSGDGSSDGGGGSGGGGGVGGGTPGLHQAGGPGDLEPEVRTESTETIEGPNGMGSIETVSISVNGVPSMGARGIGVTQGELLRQEQRAGVVPVSQLVPGHHHQQQQQQQQQQLAARNGGPANNGNNQQQQQQQRASPSTADTSSAATPSVEDPSTGESNAATDDPVVPVSATATDDEKPHARGPEEIGPEDMGPQPEGSPATTAAHSNNNAPGGPGISVRGIDVEAAVGRKADGSPPKMQDPSIATTAAASDGDKMDVDVDAGNAKASPKREAENELDGGAAGKKIKEEHPPDADADADATAGGGVKEEDGEEAEGDSGGEAVKTEEEEETETGKKAAGLTADEDEVQ